MTMYSTRWRKNKVNVSDLVNLKKHISPGSLAQRLIVDTSVGQIMFFLV